MSEVALHSDFLGAFGLLERDGCVLLAGNLRELEPGALPTLVYDLPGGRVEPGERLDEALHREWREECGVDVRADRFLFFQEGIRVVRDVRYYAWRSFFFAVETDSEPQPGEVESLLWAPKERLAALLRAPYHAGFLRWLDGGVTWQRDVWA